MRGDIENTADSTARTESEAAADTTCFGFNLLKVARYINLIVGTACVVVCGLSSLNIFNLIKSDFILGISLMQLDFFLG